jgi:hypothetical protein
MKPSVILSALLLITFSSCEEKEKVIEVVEEVPKDVFHVELCETLNATVMAMLSESHNNRDKYPQLFSDNVQGQIVLKTESDVYVSYVTESASLPSTLGFYTYEGSGPSSVDDVDRKIAFPHVSSAVLTPGDSRRLGRFKAGTVIGFFLVVGGYNDNTVNWSKPTYWTNQSFNEGEARQHVLFSEQECNNIVMAFEDKNVSGSTSDNDYNDIVFLVSDNDTAQASTAFDLNSVPSM